MLAPEFRELTQQFLGADRVHLCNACDRIIPRAKLVESPAQPAFEYRRVSEFALHFVENLSAGIDSSFHGIDAQQVVAEAMDRGAGELVEVLARGSQGFLLRRRHFTPERKRKFVWNFPDQHIRDEACDAFAKLAGRKLGECDRSNLARSRPVRQQHDHASCQQCCLAGASRGFHHQGRAPVRQRANPVLLIRKRLHGSFQKKLRSSDNSSKAGFLRRQ